MELLRNSPVRPVLSPARPPAAWRVGLGRCLSSPSAVPISSPAIPPAGFDDCGARAYMYEGPEYAALIASRIKIRGQADTEHGAHRPAIEPTLGTPTTRQPQFTETGPQPDLVSAPTSLARTVSSASSPQYDDLIHRPFHYATRTWSSGDSATELLSFDPYHAWQEQKTFSTSIAAIHAFVRPSFKILFRLSSNRFSYGRLIASHVPAGLKNILKSLPVHPTPLTSAHHAIIDASDPNPVDLIIPFSHVKERFSTLMHRKNAHEASHGTVTLNVLIPLQGSSTDRLTVQISVFISVIDLGASVAAPPHPLGASTIGQALTEDAEQLIDGVAALSRIATRAAGGIAALSLDHPHNYASGLRSQPGIIPDLQYGEGTHDSSHFSLGLSHAPINPPGGFRDFDVLDVAKQPSVAWTEDLSKWLTNANDRIVLLPLSPMLVEPYYRLKADLAPVDLRLNTNLSWASRHFIYWAGSIDVRVEIVAPNMTTGSIAVTWVPTIDQNFKFDDAKCNSLMQLPTHLIDLSVSHTLEFSVPYHQESLAKFVPTASYDYRTGANIYSHHTCNGLLAIHALNEINVPATIAQSVRLYVWLSAGDDFQLSIPAPKALPSAFVRSQAAAIDTTLSAFGGTIHGENHMSYHSLLARPSLSVLALDRDYANTDLSHNFITVVHLNNPCPLDTAEIKAPANWLNYQGGDIDLLVSPVESRHHPDAPKIESEAVPAAEGRAWLFPTALSDFSRAYARWSGSLAYRYIYNQESRTVASVEATYNPGRIDDWKGDVYRDGSTKSYIDRSFLANRVAINSTGAAGSIVAPQQAMFSTLFVSIDDGTSSHADTSGVVQFHLNSYSDRPGEFRVYQGAGNDFTLHHYAFAPATSHLSRTRYANDVPGEGKAFLVRNSYTAPAPDSAKKGKEKLAEKPAATAPAPTPTPATVGQGVDEFVTPGVAMATTAAVVAGIGAYYISHRLKELGQRVDDALVAHTAAAVAVETFAVDSATAVDAVKLTAAELERFVATVTRRVLGFLPEGTYDATHYVHLVCALADLSVARTLLAVCSAGLRLALLIPVLGSVFQRVAALFEDRTCGQAVEDLGSIRSVLEKAASENPLFCVLAILSAASVAAMYASQRNTTFAREFVGPASRDAAADTLTTLGRFVSAISATTISAAAVARGLPVLVDLYKDFASRHLSLLSEEERQIQSIRRLGPQMSDWAARVAEFDNPETNDRIAHDPVLQAKARELRIEGDDFNSIYLRHTGVPPDIRFSFFNVLGTVKRLETKARRYADNKGYRYAPFAVTLDGPPRSGKSCAVPTIFRALAALHGLEGMNHLYSYCPEDDYWSRYVGQFGTLLDDFPKVAGPSLSDQAALLVNLLNPTPYSVNMADLADKGRGFTSRVFIVTTNDAFFKVPLLVSQEAFNRRRNKVYRVRLAPINDDLNDPANVTYVEVDRSTGQVVDPDAPPLRHDQLIAALTDAYLLHQLQEFERIVASGAASPEQALGDLQGPELVYVRENARCFKPATTGTEAEGQVHIVEEGEVRDYGWIDEPLVGDRSTLDRKDDELLAMVRDDPDFRRSLPVVSMRNAKDWDLTLFGYTLGQLSSVDCAAHPHRDRLVLKPGAGDRPSRLYLERWCVAGVKCPSIADDEDPQDYQPSLCPHGYYRFADGSILPLVADRGGGSSDLPFVALPGLSPCIFRGDREAGVRTAIAGPTEARVAFTMYRALNNQRSDRESAATSCLRATIERTLPPAFSELRAFYADLAVWRRVQGLHDPDAFPPLQSRFWLFWKGYTLDFDSAAGRLLPKAPLQGPSILDTRVVLPGAIAIVAGRGDITGTPREELGRWQRANWEERALSVPPRGHRFWSIYKAASDQWTRQLALSHSDHIATTSAQANVEELIALVDMPRAVREPDDDPPVYAPLARPRSSMLVADIDEVVAALERGVPLGQLIDAYPPLRDYRDCATEEGVPLIHVLNRERRRQRFQQVREILEDGMRSVGATFQRFFEEPGRFRQVAPYILGFITLVPAVLFIYWLNRPGQVAPEPHPQPEASAGTSDGPTETPSDDEDDSDLYEMVDGMRIRLDPEAQSNKKGNKHQGRRSRARKFEDYISKDSRNQRGQAGCDESSRIGQIVARVRKSNIVELRFAGAAYNLTRRIRGLAIGDRFVLFPKHAFEIFTRSRQASGEFHVGRFKREVPTTAFERIECDALAHADLICIRYPLSIPAARSIRSLLLTGNELDRFTRTTGLLDVARPESPAMPIPLASVTLHGLDKPNIVYPTDDHGGTGILDEAFSYQAATSSGDCGSPLFAMSGPHAGKLLGIHCAGPAANTGVGIGVAGPAWSVALTVDMVDGIFYLATGDPRPSDAIAGQACIDDVIDTSECGHPIVATGLAPYHVARDTRLVATIFASADCPHPKHPAVLHPHDPRQTHPGDPLARALTKYARADARITPEEYDALHAFYSDHYLKLRASRGADLAFDVLDFMDSYSGAGITSSIDPRTSTGPSYAPLGYRKADLVKDYERFECGGPKGPIHEAFDARLDALSHGLLYPTAFAEVLKDEKRTLAKIRDGATRSFTLCDLDFNLAIRSFTLDFLTLIRRSRDVSHCQIGLSYTREWNLLAARLARGRDEPLVCDADYRAFDGAVSGDFIALFFDIATTVYGDGLATERRIIAQQLSHRFSRYGTHTISLDTGMPSGCAVTGEVNSFTNSAVLHVAHARGAREDGDDRPLIELFRDFDLLCDHVTYGDDLIIAPDAPDYPLDRLFRHAAQLGFDATAGDKAGPPRLRPLYTPDGGIDAYGGAVAFLKFAFRKVGPTVHPLLDLDSLRAMLDYTRTGGEDWDLATSVRIAESFVARYPRSVYDAFFLPYRAIALHDRLPVRFRPHSEAMSDHLEDYDSLTDNLFE